MLLIGFISPEWRVSVRFAGTNWRVGMSKYHNDNSFASDPGHIRLSDEKLRQFHPEFYGFRSWISALARASRGRIAEHMELGDSRAAVVINLDPLLVAAYTDEMDDSAVLRFDASVKAQYPGLRVASRLLTVNTYSLGGRLVPDLINGPASLRQYCNFYPIIAEFVSDDLDRIETRKQQIDELEWRRARYAGADYLQRNQGRTRDGRPKYSMKPA
jgi:hypothetical protein